MLINRNGLLIIITRMRSRWGAIANPHAKVFDPQQPQVPPLGHEQSNRIKNLFNIFSSICGEHAQSLVQKSRKLTW